MAEKEHVSIVICGHVDAGKCLKEGTLVCMYNGDLVPVENIVTGDLLMGDDSSARTVLSTTSGSGNLYKVIQNRGIEYSVNENHILTLKASNVDRIFYDETSNRYTCRWMERSDHEDLYERTFSIKEHNFEVQSGDILNSQKRSAEQYMEDIRQSKFYVRLGDEIDISIKKYLGLDRNVQDCLVGFSVYNNARTSTSIKIENDGVGQYHGFELDGNGRFLLEDYTVTHNSTSTGRLIFDLGGIDDRKMAKLQAEADAVGKGSFAFYMDMTTEEQQRGVTIKSTVKEFFTETKHYTIIDDPGHRDFIKNMITGSSQADVALVLVPADGNFTTSIAKGNLKAGEVQGQTRQHALLVNLLGVKQLIIGINKTDCDVAKYSEERYNEIKNEMANILNKVGWKKDFVTNNVAFIPYSGYKGDNLTTKSENMPWWKGMDIDVPGKGKVHVDTILDCLDKVVQTPQRDPGALMRMPVGDTLNIKGVGDVFTGRVEQGTLKKGTTVKLLPTHTKANPCTGKVFSIEMHHRQLEEAGPGNNVGSNIKGLPKGNMPRSGDIMVLCDDNSIGAVKEFTMQVKIMTHPGKLKVGYTLIAFCRTSKSAVKMTKINWKIGKSTGGQKLENPPFLKANEMAEIVFEPIQPFVVDSFKRCEGLGRVAIMEGNSVVMLGKVTDTVLKE